MSKILIEVDTRDTKSIAEARLTLSALDGLPAKTIAEAQGKASGPVKGETKAPAKKADVKKTPKKVVEEDEDDLDDEEDLDVGDDDEDEEDEAPAKSKKSNKKVVDEDEDDDAPTVEDVITAGRELVMDFDGQKEAKAIFKKYKAATAKDIKAKDIPAALKDLQKALKAAKAAAESDDEEEDEEDDE